MKRGEKFLAYIFPAIALAGFLGRGVFNISLLLSLLLFISLSAEIRYRILLKDPVLRAWVLFLAAVAVAGIFALEPLFSFGKLTLFAFYSVVILAIGIYLYRYSLLKRSNLQKAINVISFSALFISILVISNTAIGFDLLEYVRKGVIVPQYGNYHFRLSISVNIFAIALYWAQYRRIPFLLLSVMAVETMGVFCSGSRTAMVAYVGMLVVYMFFRNGRKIFSKEIAAAAVLIGAAIAVSYFISPYAKIRIGSFDTTFLPKGDHMSGRYELFSATSGKIQQSLLYGYGVKSAVKHPVKYGSSSSKHPHNIYLEILLDSGLIGFSAFLFFLWVLYREFGTLSGEDSAASIYASLSGLFLTSLASWSIWSTNHISVMLMILTLLLGMKSIAGDPQQ